VDRLDARYGPRHCQLRKTEFDRAPCRVFCKRTPESSGEGRITVPHKSMDIKSSTACVIRREFWRGELGGTTGRLGIVRGGPNRVITGSVGEIPMMIDCGTVPVQLEMEKAFSQ
jgi:hypothetical protein